MRHLLLLVAAIIHFGTFTGRAQTPIDIEEYGDLFDSVQTREIFTDQKTFVDCIPKYPPREILEKYHIQREREAFDLKDFVAGNFDTSFVNEDDVLDHIDDLWDRLSRDPDDHVRISTLIPLKHPYIVPGGRFREIYYWDSYFTMLGLAEAGKYEMIRDMLDNMADLLYAYGNIPNGNRTYYLSRSQPPYFSLMVDLFAQCTEDTSIYRSYHRALKTEYDFWNKGREHLTETFTGRERIVMLQDGDFLNRYWDNLSTPRPESYLNDVTTRKNSGRDSTIYRDIRAAAESGWDFSSRWFADDSSITTIHTTDFIPVDLNCLLYNLEVALGKGCREDSGLMYSKAAEKRKKLIMDYCWDEERGFFFDFNFKTRNRSDAYCLASLYPLFLKMVDPARAERVLDVIQRNFLQDGGLVTTLIHTGQQWDYPNGWPPLQWIGYQSCMNYGMNELANDMALRWIDLNRKVFGQTGKMMEKYDVVDMDKPGGGGEYQTQDGFGWTNGVFLKLWNDLNK